MHLPYYSGKKRKAEGGKGAGGKKKKAEETEEEKQLKVKLSPLMTKPTKWHVRPVKTQISLGIRPV